MVMMWTAWFDGWSKSKEGFGELYTVVCIECSS